jgi:sugar lactone lactonase YvrE
MDIGKQHSGQGLKHLLVVIIVVICLCQFIAPTQVNAQFAIACSGGIDFNGNNVTVDSFDSTDPYHSYWPNYPIGRGYGIYTNTGTTANVVRKANGNLETSSSIVGIISVGNAEIYGSVMTGPGGTSQLGSYGSVGDINWVDAGTQGIQPGHARDDLNGLFPDIILPIVAWTPLTNNANIVNSGYYAMNQITGNMTITATNVVLYVTNGVSLSGNKIFTIGTNASVTIYAGNLISDGPAGYINNASQHASQLTIYGLPTLNSISLKGYGPFWGVIYAPEAMMQYKGNGASGGFYGSLACYSLRLTGNATFSRDEAVLVTPLTAPVSVAIQPSNGVAIAGSTVTLSAVISSPFAQPFYWQWYFNQTNLLRGGTNISSLALTNVLPTNSGNYSVVASYSMASVTSTPVALQVIAPLSITLQPTNQIVLAGSPVAFTTAASGSTPLAYQWQFNGANLPDGIISTVAGNGTAGYSGDGGPAINASLNRPLSISLDTAGNLLVSDRNNNRIRKIARNGIITTLAGDGTTNYVTDGAYATNAGFIFIGNAISDASGNYFIADTGHHRLRKVDTNGILTTIAGDGLTNYSPIEIPATNCSLYYPDALAFDQSGNLFFSTGNASRVCKIDTNGILTTVAGNTNLFVIQQGDDGKAATNVGLPNISAIAPDGAGQLFVSEYFGPIYGFIRKVDTNGIISTYGGSRYAPDFFYGDGGYATNAGMSPGGLSFNGSSDLFFADRGNNRVRKIDSYGIITTVAGNGTTNFTGDGLPAISSGLYMPWGVAMDAGGNVFIAESGNNRIRKIFSSTKPILIPSAFTTNNAGYYSVQITNQAGSVVSSNAMLIVVASPMGHTNLIGDSVSFSAPTFGPGSVSWQWQKDGTNLTDGGNISGSATAQLTLTSVSVTDVGSYRAIVSSSAGTVVTDAAMLVVYPTFAASLGGTVRSSTNAFQFQLTGVPGFSYVVQSSTNLIDWTSLLTNTAPFTFTDAPVNPFPQLFYRAVFQQ